MTWRRHKGQDVEQELDDLEKTLSLDNLVNTEVKTTFPTAQNNTAIQVVDENGIFYLVVTAKGTRHRVQMDAF